MLSTQKLPFRSTMPFSTLVSPLVSTICAEIVTVGSSTQPRQVKLVPQISAPFVGQYSASAGGLVLVE